MLLFAVTTTHLGASLNALNGAAPFRGLIRMLPSVLGCHQRHHSIVLVPASSSSIGLLFLVHTLVVDRDRLLQFCKTSSLPHPSCHRPHLSATKCSVSTKACRSTTLPDLPARLSLYAASRLYVFSPVSIPPIHSLLPIPAYYLHYANHSHHHLPH